MRAVGLILLAAASLAQTGCGILWAHKHAEVTAVSLNACDPHCGKDAGIPFYLPKPLLVVSKNFRNIEEARTGLTDSAPIPQAFDDQSKYADLNARTNFAGLQSPAAPSDGGGAPGGGSTSGTPGTASKSEPRLHSANGAPLSPGVAPVDGLSPATFYTYQVVFVPDMTQKYGLRIKGGPGEIRAAMNLVNGWQFTGLGPFYLKDSSTAQNVLASGISARLGGQAAADVLNASANLAKAFPAAPGGGGTSAPIDASHPAVAKMGQTLAALPLNCTPCKIENFAEIHVYEPHLTPDGRMEWCEIVNLKFDRDYLGAAAPGVLVVPADKPMEQPKGQTPPPGGTSSADLEKLNGVNSEVGKAALSAVFGIGLGGPSAPPGGGTSGAIGAPAAGSVNQIQVDCDGGESCHKGRSFSLFSFHREKKAPAPRPTIVTRSVTLPAAGVTTSAPAPGGQLQPPPKTKTNEQAPPPGGTGDE
ncbi:MAG: hypothetical protein KF873_04905 [Gemmataceae bacterium]|nr:hypothetical protein [Gemmataceae bacterium]